MTEPTAEQQAGAATTTAEPDRYADAWARFNAGVNGVVPETRLVNRRHEGDGLVYDIEPSPHDADQRPTAEQLSRNAERLAAGLNLPPGAVLFHDTSHSGPYSVRLTIIEKNLIAKPRYFDVPEIDGGVLKDVARPIDGRGAVDLTMWSADGTVPTMVVGPSHTPDATLAVYMLACGALASGRMSLLHIDPKGYAAPALRRQARVSIVGVENARRAWTIVDALVRARTEHAVRTGQHVLLPSAELPGWNVVHHAFSQVTCDARAYQAWSRLVSEAPRLGLWPVAENDSLDESKWGNDRLRAAFGRQAVVFGLNAVSRELLPGLRNHPRHLPVDDDGGPISGMALHVGPGQTSTPARWHALPDEHEDLVDAPPLRLSSAPRACDRQPELARIDVEALTALLGPPVKHRWLIGGPHATHVLPE